MTRLPVGDVSGYGESDRHASPHSQDSTFDTMAFIQEIIEVEVSPREGHYAVVCFLTDLLQNLHQKSTPIGHLQVCIQAEDCNFTLDHSALRQTDWADLLPRFEANQFTLILDLSAHAHKRVLREAICESIEVLCWNVGAICLEKKHQTSDI
jgi:hypothetical protein